MSLTMINTPPTTPSAPDSRSTPSLENLVDKDPEEIEETENTASPSQIFDDTQFIRAVQFNAGCSSSNTDIDKLIEFYNEHSNEETLAKWMQIYEEQKLSPLARQKNREISDSVGDLLHAIRGCPVPLNRKSKEAPFNRSMDFDITKNRRPSSKCNGFFALEKCMSADFPARFDHSTRLERCKEMPNIADVDDDVEY